VGKIALKERGREIAGGMRLNILMLSEIQM
jgi:hypothetical protein